MTNAGRRWISVVSAAQTGLAQCSFSSASFPQHRRVLRRRLRGACSRTGVRCLWFWPESMAGEYGLWAIPFEVWPRSPVITRKVRGRVQRSYGRCHSRVAIEDGCSCLTLERGGREVNAFTCPLCIRTCLNETADDARELLLQVRFVWAWRGVTRLARTGRSGARGT